MDQRFRLPPRLVLLADRRQPGSAYPDYFFFGDPHINFYESTAEFDDLDLYIPDDGPR